MSTDLINFGSEKQQHVALFATLHFLEKTGKLPQPNNEEDAAAVVASAKELLANGTIAIEDFDLDESFVAR